ncbi:MAG: hypothetical protein WCL70_06195 [Paludibacter sp.]
MARKILIFLLTGYFLIGAIVLPDSDFALSSNLLKIYYDFNCVNHPVNYLKFIDVQFFESFEFYDIEDFKDSNPQEKKQKPVPIYPYIAQQSSAFILQIQKNEFLAVTPYIEYTIFYWNFYRFVQKNSVFHPPKLLV